MMNWVSYQIFKNLWITYSSQLQSTQLAPEPVLLAVYMSLGTQAECRASSGARASSQIKESVYMILFIRAGCKKSQGIKERGTVSVERAELMR